MWLRATTVRPYRAKTNGKVERSNGYLKDSFLMPLVARLHVTGLNLTAEVANAHVRLCDAGLTRLKRADAR